MSLLSGVFPTAWKHVIVAPIHKKGDLFDLSHYRPISLLPIISKVFEKLVNAQLRDYLNTNNIIHEVQHGFHQLCSCQTALLQLTKNLFTLRAAKKFTYVTALDFSRAFDTININILQQRLSSFSSGTTSSWFSSYLTNRLQSTKYANALSDACAISTGIPQGTVLALTLFSIYLNNLQQLLTPNEVIAYADDVTLISSGSTPQEAVTMAESTIAKIYSWTTANSLVLNIQKCQTIIISPSARKRAIALSLLVRNSSASIAASTELCILRVIISDDLKWSKQATYVRKSISNMVNVLNRFGTSLNNETRKRIFNSFVSPKMHFCAPVWCWVGPSDLKSMNHTIQRAARVILHNSWAELNHNIFTTTGLLPFELFNHHKSLLATHQLLQPRSTDLYLPALLQHTCSSRCATRGTDGHKFQLPRHTSVTFEQCFYYMGAKLWNNLPASLISLSSLTKFKESTLQYLLTSLT